MTRIAVLDDYQHRAPTFADWASLAPGTEVEFFSHPIERAALADTLAGFDVLVVMRERTALPREVLEHLTGLRLLVTTGMRNAAVDIAYLRSRGVLACGTGAGPSAQAGAGAAAAGRSSTVEVAWALILAAVKRVTVEDRALRAGHWQLDLPGNLAGATLGLAGLGRLGAEMVAPARVFGMEVLAWSEHLTAERAAEVGVRRVEKATLLADSDVVSIHLVLGERTRGLFGAAELAAMKPSAVLVNTSRGPIVDERALVEALRSHTIAAAGLDVFDQEPLPPDHDLLGLDNAVLLPHLGYVSESGLRAMYTEAVQDIAAWAAGAPVRVLDG